MKNYIFLLLAVLLIGLGYFLVSDIPETVSHMRGAKTISPSHVPPAATNIFTISNIANITGILSFMIQMGIWVKSTAVNRKNKNERGQ